MGVMLVVLVVVISLILFFVLQARRKALPSSSPPPPERVPETSETKPESSSSATPAREAFDTIRKDDAAPLDTSPEEAPEGVRLDESEEKQAVKELEAARNERKLQHLRSGLEKTRKGLIGRIISIFKDDTKIDPTILEDLEEALITADLGIPATEWLIATIRKDLDASETSDASTIRAHIRQAIRNTLSVTPPPWNWSEKPFVIMVVGVNGAGKTTTIGKLASQLTENGKTVVLAAADTFRAAAVNQLEIWGRRAGCEVIKPTKEGADPSSVVYDAVQHATATAADVVIIDTAGRLHTQTPLMDELKKIKRVCQKAVETAPHEILLVLDATTGQNAITQVKEFNDALDLSSIALTKLDGTAKGGVIIGICHEHKIGIRYIGIGETKESLRDFQADDFVEALFAEDNVVSQ